MTRRDYHVTAALIRRNDHILVQQQEPADPAATLPGGGVEHGELLTEALIREVCEETGLVIEEIGPLPYMTQLDRAAHETYSLAFTFEVVAWSGNIQRHDPDNVILGAEFDDREDALTKVDTLPWRVMREPLYS